jgi:hypothetical protein
MDVNGEESMSENALFDPNSSKKGIPPSGKSGFFLFHLRESASICGSFLFK